MVDILLATYNGERYIREQLKSIVNQSVTDWQLLISDDCSSDRTMEIINEFVSTDPRITVVSKEVKYGSAKTNFLNLLQYSTADLVFFCDQDDIWDAEKLAHYIGIYEKFAYKKTPILIYSDAIVVDKKLNEISPSFYSLSKINPRRNAVNQLLVQNVVVGCTACINAPLRDAMKKIVINDNRIIMHDWVAAILASTNDGLIYLHEPFVLYRQHSNNSVGVDDDASLAVWLKKLRTNPFDRARNTYRQAKALLEYCGEDIGDKYKWIIREYCDMNSERKLTRVRKLFKLKIWKSTLPKRFFQILTV